MVFRMASGLMDRVQQYARDGGAEEICGILLGQEHKIRELILARNVAAHPNSLFEIDPAALIAAERRARSGGPDVIGYFHSHPGGPCQPSRTDASHAAADNRLWLIVNGHDYGAWLAVSGGSVHGRFEPAALELTIVPHAN
jgi:proteasome lid subunit RPN8/RPN11